MEELSYYAIHPFSFLSWKMLTFNIRHIINPLDYLGKKCQLQVIPVRAFDFTPCSAELAVMGKKAIRVCSCHSPKVLNEGRAEENENYLGDTRHHLLYADKGSVPSQKDSWEF